MGEACGMSPCALPEAIGTFSGCSVEAYDAHFAREASCTRHARYVCDTHSLFTFCKASLSQIFDRVSTGQGAYVIVSQSGCSQGVYQS